MTNAQNAPDQHAQGGLVGAWHAMPGAASQAFATPEICAPGVSTACRVHAVEAETARERSAQAKWQPCGKVYCRAWHAMPLRKACSPDGLFRHASGSRCSLGAAHATGAGRAWRACAGFAQGRHCVWTGRPPRGGRDRSRMPTDGNGHAVVTPLATLYTDATLTVTAPNPLQTDGIGNYHFYAPSGRYMIQITGTNITGTMTYPDVILAADSSAGGSGSDITAFGLTLGGNLSVAGNASIAGTFSTGNFSPSALSVTGNSSVAGPRPYIDVTAYGAVGNNIHDDTSAIQAAINAYCTGQTLSNGGSIYFPPGTYSVAQPQTPSTSPVFTICTGIHFLLAGIPRYTRRRDIR